MIDDYDNYDGYDDDCDPYCKICNPNLDDDDDLIYENLDQNN